MKLRQLESILEDVNGFVKPKLNLEQYETTPHLAACLLHTAETQFGDLSERSIADLGCGCGMLSIGSILMEADSCIGVDIDPDALLIFQENCLEFEVEHAVDYIQADVRFVKDLFAKKFDTVVMNPPFGTKCNKGIDMDFLYCASKIAETAVYSFHKTTTREHVVKKAKDFGMNAQVIADANWLILVQPLLLNRSQGQGKCLIEDRSVDASGIFSGLLMKDIVIF